MTAGIFIVLLALGVPIFVVLALTSLTFVALTENWPLLASFIRQFYQGMNSYGLLAIPVFILVGELMNAGGLTRRLIAMANAVLGRLTGGLAYVSLAANMMMAAIVGSAIAQIAVMSRVMVQEMAANGYRRDQSAAITCAGGLLGAVVPPSMPFVVFAVLAQISVGDMFLAGVVPGLLIALGYLVIIIVQGRIQGFPRGGPSSISHADGAHPVVSGIPALFIPLAIIGSIVGGLATPTEAAGIAAALALFIGGAIHREMRFSDIGPVLARTVRGSVIALALIAAASVFGWVIVFEQIPQRIAAFMVSLTHNPALFLLLVVCLLLAVGMLLDGIAALILVVPVLLPIATGDYGIGTLQFGVIVVVTLVLGLLTPPVGAGVYVAAAMSNVPPNHLFQSIAPYILAVLGVLSVLVLWPWVIDFWI